MLAPIVKRTSAVGSMVLLLIAATSARSAETVVLESKFPTAAGG